MPSSFRRLLVAAAALLAFAGSSGAGGVLRPDDPRAPVAALYAIEKAGRPTLATPLERAASLTRGLAGLWDRAEARARRGGDVAIDFDVVTNSQGAELKSYALAATRTARPSSRPSTPAIGRARRRARTSSPFRCCARPGAGASTTSAASPSRTHGRCATCSRAPPRAERTAEAARRYSAPSVFSSAIWPSVAQWSAAGDSATPSASPAAR